MAFTNSCRPSTINSKAAPILPEDFRIPTDRKSGAPTKRSDLDPPTPLTMVRWSVEVAAPLWNFAQLEKEDPHQSNHAEVARLHELSKKICHHCPPWFRSENPDMTFDSHPDCQWIPRARATLQSSAAFGIMALHRPYIFTNANSRTEALKASLTILRAQRTLFTMIESRDYKTFSLVLNSFDAIVLIAAIYIMFPYENRDDLEDSLQHFEWGMDRFKVMSGRNNLARSALGVLKIVHHHLKRALNGTKPAITQINNSTPSTIVSSPPITTYGSYNYNITRNTPHGSLSSDSSAVNDSQYPQQVSMPNLGGGSVNNGWDNYAGAMQVPHGYNLGYSITPLQPMHDLLDRGLAPSGVSAPMIDPQLMELTGNVNSNGSWQFEGEFTNDSFWGFMNNHSMA